MTNSLFPDTEVNKVFGDVLKRYRQECGISQEELAFKAGIDRTYVSRLERGIRQPTITTLLGLGVALGVSSSDLIKETERRIFQGENSRAD